KRLIGAAPSLASRRLVSAAERAETREQAVTSARSAAAAPDDPADAQAPEFGYAPSDPDAVIEVQNLTKEFPIRGTVPWRTTPFPAVDAVPFAIGAAPPPRSWASPARASPPWRRWSSSSSSPPPVGCSSRARTSPPTRARS